MTANRYGVVGGAQMAGRPERTNQGGVQTKGGNYENPGGDVNGTMATRMSATTTSGQPDNSELSRFMNNGGGPEPHQGSNPGAQSDPGPKEVGFYDQAGKHMGGDDGVQAAAGRAGGARMGGLEGTPPNAGERGGQNTGTSGAQTSAYSPEGEYGAGSYGGGGIGTASGAGNGQTGARSDVGGDGTMGSETRNPVGFASSLDDGAGQAGQAGQTGQSWQPDQPQQAGGARTMGYTGDSGSQPYEGAYQSRAAQRLVDMREDMPQAFSRTGEPYDEKPRAADKAGEVADAVKGKAGGFFSRARDRMEDFLAVDLNNDGSIGASQHPTREPSYGDGARMEPQAFETREAKARMEPQAFETREAKARMEPQAFETRERAQYGGEGAGVGEDDGMTGRDDSFTVFYGEKAGAAMDAEAQQRELVDA